MLSIYSGFLLLPDSVSEDCISINLSTCQDCPLSPLLFNIVLEALVVAIRQEKDIKAIQIGKEEVKLSLFANDVLVYIENSLDSTKKLLSQVNLAKHRIQSQYSEIKGIFVQQQ